MKTLKKNSRRSIEKIFLSSRLATGLMQVTQCICKKDDLKEVYDVFTLVLLTSKTKSKPSHFRVKVLLLTCRKISSSWFMLVAILRQCKVASSFALYVWHIFCSAKALWESTEFAVVPTFHILFLKIKKSSLRFCDLFLIMKFKEFDEFLLWANFCIDNKKKSYAAWCWLI